jgi:hypothetical protein
LGGRGHNNYRNEKKGKIISDWPHAGKRGRIWICAILRIYLQK